MKHFFSTEFWTSLFQSYGERVFCAVLQIVLTVALLIAARIILFRVIDRTMGVIIGKQKGSERQDRQSRTRTLASLLRSVTAYILTFIAGLMILRALGVDALPLLTTAGVVGLSVGFGSQKLVRDVISGFFILLENQYVVGEYVTIGLVSGVVEEVGMRTTRIRDDIGRLTIISNGEIAQVTNHSRGSFLTSVDISVPSTADLDRVVEILRQIGRDVAEERRDVMAPFSCDGVAAMDGIKVTLRLIGRVDPSSQQDIQMDIRRRVRNVFAEANIALA